MSKKNSSLLVRGLAAVLPVLSLAATATLAGSCAGASEEPASQDLAAATQAMGVTGGEVPIPWDAANDEATWDGTYAELAYVDALAQCSLRNLLGGGKANTLIAGDPAFLWLVAKSGSAVAACPAAQTKAAAFANAMKARVGTLDDLDTASLVWLTLRNEPDCNRDVASGTPAGLGTDEDLSGYLVGKDSPYWVPEAAELKTKGWDGTMLARARDAARDQLEYAWLNGCIAQTLRQHLESSQVAFVNSRELTELQRFIMERASSAVFQYSLLFRAFGELKSSATPASLSNPKEYLRLLALWASELTAAEQQSVAADFALAVDATVQAAEQRADLLLRTPEAQDAFGTYDAEGWLEGGRAEVLESLYGLFTDEPHRAASVELSAPEIGTLLGFLRAADAVQLSGASGTFDLPASGSALYRAAESWLRKVECQKRDTQAPASCWAVATTESPDGFALKTEFHVDLSHAEALAEGLVEFLLGGPLSGRDTRRWAYCDAASKYHPCSTWRLPADLGLRVSGKHQLTGDFAKSTGGVLKLDKDFALVGLPPSGHGAETWAYLPAERLSPYVPPEVQGFGFMGEWALHEPGFEDGSDVLYFSSWDQQTRPPRRTVGAVPILAVAREALSRLADSPLLQASYSALDLIEEAIGSSQVVVYPRYDTVIAKKEVKNGQTLDPCGEVYGGWGYFTPTPGDPVADATAKQVGPTSCSLLKRAAGTQGNQPEYRVFVSSPTEVATSLSLEHAAMPTVLTESTATKTVFTSSALESAALKTARGRSYVSSRLVTTRDELVDLRLVEKDGQKTPVFRGALEPPTWNLDALTVYVNGLPDCKFVTDPNTSQKVLEKQPCAYPWQRAFVKEAKPVNFRGRAPYFALHTPSTRGRVVTYGGRLNQLAARAWAFQADNWSRPAYDGLGLPRDWTPVGDAALHGGGAGEEVYQYFLRQASEAADEATAAIQKALDQLEAEANDAFALQGAEQKAEGLAELQVTALCGAGGGSCDITTKPSKLSVLPCAAGEGSCEKARNLLTHVLGLTAEGGYPLAKAVTDELGNPTPLFDAYRGGKLQGLFVQQWSAWQELKLGVSAAMKGVLAAVEQLKLAEAQKKQAEVDYDAALAELKADAATQDANLAEEKARRAEWVAQMDLMNARVDPETGECSAAAYDAARDSGVSVSSVAWTHNEAPGEHPTHAATGESRYSWSPGPWHAQKQKCEEAKRQWEAMQPVIEEKRQAWIRAIAAAVRQTIARTKKREAATLRYQNSGLIVPAATATFWSQFLTELQGVQGALDRLYASTAAIDLAFGETALGVARLELERGLDTATVKNRYGLRRRFRSYELWRARALSENARRLSVAARRAVEARFLVDLSRMEGTEPFVEAPSLWADEVYESDLSPPAALGRSLGPSGEGVFANKLTDYVNNLELFVTGYAVERPSATVRADVEVLQIPGPAEAESAVFGDLESRGVSLDSSGWTFFCAAENAWIAHPGLGKQGGKPADILTACNGVAPTRARLGFWLDPWGRVGGSAARAPYTARYNTRWRELAVNFVGTGIRDCSTARDATACYSEPFLRYDLRHVGPAEVTNHEQEWWRLKLPTAWIEGGKALVAEEWLDPVTNNFQQPYVASVSRGEYAGRPLGGTYQLDLLLTPDVRLDRIERIQVLVETEYWVRQTSPGVEESPVGPVCGDGVVEGSELCDGNCPASCTASADECAPVVRVGNVLLCNVQCAVAPITACIDDDGCCAEGCGTSNDTDCAAHY